MATMPAPRTYFGPGPTVEYTTTLTLPSEVYASPSAVRIVTENFLSSLKVGLTTLSALTQSIGVDISRHAEDITVSVNRELLISPAFTRAFTNTVMVSYGVNSGDQGKSIAVYVIVTVAGVTRQFFASTVNANKGVAMLSPYGNAQDN